jgi:hypothetical protein
MLHIRQLSLIKQIKTHGNSSHGFQDEVQSENNVSSERRYSLVYTNIHYISFFFYRLFSTLFTFHRVIEIISYKIFKVYHPAADECL